MLIPVGCFVGIVVLWLGIAVGTFNWVKYPGGHGLAENFQLQHSVNTQEYSHSLKTKLAYTLDGKNALSTTTEQQLTREWNGKVW